MILISYIELKFQILSKFMIKLTHPNAEKKKKKLTHPKIVTNRTKGPVSLFVNKSIKPNKPLLLFRFMTSIHLKQTNQT